MEILYAFESSSTLSHQILITLTLNLTYKLPSTIAFLVKKYTNAIVTRPLSPSRGIHATLWVILKHSLRKVNKNIKTERFIRRKCRNKSSLADHQETFNGRNFSKSSFWQFLRQISAIRDEKQTFADFLVDQR